MKLNTSILALAIPAALAGCSSTPTNMPLVFGESITVGISIAATTTDQGADFTLGYKSKDVAIVPVSVLKTDGGVEKLQAHITNTATADVPGSTSDDAYSVIGQFSVETGQQGHQVGLGKFFATGQAAQVLSEGFRMRMENESSAKKTATTTP